MKVILFTATSMAVSTVLAQTRYGLSSSRPADPVGQFPRLAACPDPHACIFPPDVSSFAPGVYFDIRVELHAYGNDSNSPTPKPYEDFTTQIRKNNEEWYDLSNYFGKNDSSIENWNFNWIDSIETLYARVLKNDRKPIKVAVTSRVWRRLKFKEPGEYEVKVNYAPNESYSVKYIVVNPKKPKKKAKNVILFISDGTNVGMITAARAISRKHTSGKFDRLLSFEDFDQLGHVITNGIDSLITDSSNSASSYATGHKGAGDILGVHADSSADYFDDPKVELITELIRRRQPKKAIGIVTTAFGQDATPAAFTSHTRFRDTYAEITDQILNGIGNWTTSGVAPDVWLAGGAEYFAGPLSYNQNNYFDEFSRSGYHTVLNKTALLSNPDKSKKLFGVFRKESLDVWIERNVYINNTIGNKASPDLSGNDALGSEQPGLSDMTLSALEVLKERGGEDGFFMLSEAASVDKKLHVYDFGRAWADLIELDVTINKTVEWLKKNGEYEDTLILVTADHAHAFDVWGSVDQKYMNSHSDDLGMRNSIGVYYQAGWPGYADLDGDGFPDDWTPSITLAAGTNNGPPRYESWRMSTDGPRVPFIVNGNGETDANPKDSAGKYGTGLKWNSNLPYGQEKGVHSMSDVFIYSNGPGSDLFKKTMENWELFFKMGEAMDLLRPTEKEK